VRKRVEPGEVVQGSSSKRRCDSSSKKLVQRSLLDYMVPSDSGGARCPPSRPPGQTPAFKDENGVLCAPNKELSAEIASMNKATSRSKDAVRRGSSSPAHAENKPDGLAGLRSPGQTGGTLYKQQGILQPATCGRVPQQGREEGPLAPMDLNKLPMSPSWH
jgi:hypothetical protein